MRVSVGLTPRQPSFGHVPGAMCEMRTQGKHTGATMKVARTLRRLAFQHHGMTFDIGIPHTSVGYRLDPQGRS